MDDRIDRFRRTYDELERQYLTEEPLAELLEHPMPGQVLIDVEAFRAAGDGYDGASRETVTELDKANAITSLTAGSRLASTEMHKPVLDIDLPVKVIPSSTPGHFHLYIDKAMTWPRYKTLLTVLADAGIVERGYVDASIRRGYTAVRLPWVPKDRA